MKFLYGIIMGRGHALFRIFPFRLEYRLDGWSLSIPMGP